MYIAGIIKWPKAVVIKIKISNSKRKAKQINDLLIFTDIL